MILLLGIVTIRLTHDAPEVRDSRVTAFVRLFRILSLLFWQLPAKANLVSTYSIRKAVTLGGYHCSQGWAETWGVHMDS